jgi:hypothetical protein
MQAKDCQGIGEWALQSYVGHSTQQLFVTFFQMDLTLDSQFAPDSDLMGSITKEPIISPIGKEDACCCHFEVAAPPCVALTIPSGGITRIVDLGADVQ